MERRENTPKSDQGDGSISHEAITRVIMLCQRVEYAKKNTKAPDHYAKAIGELSEVIAHDDEALKALLMMKRLSVLSS